MTEQQEPFWKPLEAELEKALAQVRRGEITSIVLLKAGVGVERVSDGYTAAFSGPEYDLVSILAQLGMARVNIEGVLWELRSQRAHMNELKMLMETADPETLERLKVDYAALEAEGVTPLP